MIVADLLRLHEVGVLFHHLLFEISEGVCALGILILWNDVLRHLGHIIEALNEFAWLIIHHMDVEARHSAVVLQRLFIVRHLGHKGSSLILQLERKIARCRAKASLELSFYLGNLAPVVEPELLHPHRENVVRGVKLNDVLGWLGLLLGHKVLVYCFY